LYSDIEHYDYIEHCTTNGRHYATGIYGTYVYNDIT
jgi:hypothetical protein